MTRRHLSCLYTKVNTYAHKYFIYVFLSKDSEEDSEESDEERRDSDEEEGYDAKTDCGGLGKETRRRMERDYRLRGSHAC